MSSGRTVPGTASRHVAASRTVADVEQAGVTADRQCPGAHDLHAGVLLGVVRRGNRDAAVQAEVADGEVDHLRADEPEIEDVRAGVGGAAAHRVGERG